MNQTPIRIFRPSRASVLVQPGRWRLGLLCVVLVILSGCGASGSAAFHRPVPHGCSLADYRSMVEHLAGGSGSRYATDGHENFNTMRFLEDQFHHVGLVPGGDHGRYRQCYTSPSGTRACNVVGLVPGSGKLAQQAVVVAAHFDGHARPKAIKTTFGADDNASGAAGLIVLGQMLRRPLVSAPRRTLVLVALNGSATERGGALAFLKTPPVALKNIAISLLLHRIGRLNNTLEIQTLGSDPDHHGPWSVMDRALLGAELHVASKLIGASCGRDDASLFAHRGVPTATVTTGHSSQMTDPSHTLNWDGARRILDVVGRMVHRALYRL